MRYFPVFMDVSQKPVLVVGGGDVASRKVDALLNANADVTIIAPVIAPYLSQLVQRHECQWREESYTSACLTRDWVQVWATTNDKSLNHQIFHDAHQLNLLVNVVDDLPYCDFITPSMVSRGQIQIAISSGGASPVLIRNIRESIEAVLPLNTGLLADFAGNQRDDIKTRLPSVDARRVFWEQFFADPRVKDACTAEELAAVYQAYCQAPQPHEAQELWVLAEDVELLPIKALREMQQAEFVLYGLSECDTYLEFCRRDAVRHQYHNDDELKQQLMRLRETVSRLVIILHHTEMHCWQQWGQGQRLIVSGAEHRS